MSDHPHIALGNAGNGEATHSLPVYPQPWTRIVKRLGRLMESFEAPDGELDTQAVVQSLQLSGKLYEVFEVFVPNITDWLPEHEFNGYDSPQAWKDEREDGENDKAPTFPQFLDAFETIIEVNGGQRFLGLLGKVFPPTWIQVKFAEAVESWQEDRRLEKETLSPGSPNSPGTSGGSHPSASTPTSPTVEGPASASEIESLDFVPRSQWMRSPGKPLTTSG